SLTYPSFASFFLPDPPTTALYTLSLHDALPISISRHCCGHLSNGTAWPPTRCANCWPRSFERLLTRRSLTPREMSASNRSNDRGDRKSTRLNSSHVEISYAVFCLKKKKHTHRTY